MDIIVGYVSVRLKISKYFIVEISVWIGFLFMLACNRTKFTALVASATKLQHNKF